MPEASTFRDSSTTHYRGEPGDTLLSACRTGSIRFSGETERILNALHEAVILVAADLRIVWANESTRTVFDPGDDEHVGRYCCNVLHRSFESGKPVTEHVEPRTGRFLELWTMPLPDDAGSVGHVLVFARDVTEQVKIFAEAGRTDHLSSLGELAAGIAHEINNPINGIINYAQILLNRLYLQGPDCDIARRIITEGERIAGIVQSLLTFAGQDMRGRVGISLMDLLSGCLSLTRAQLEKDGIRLLLDIEANLPRLRVNGTQIRQVFLNLISNARHALNDRFPEAHEDKILRIAAKRIENDFGAYLQMEFLDHGSGIPPEALDRVFTPFFSTKPGGMGAGLGLSTSRNILVQHNGTIKVDSVYGDYTRITIEVPIQEK